MPIDLKIDYNFGHCLIYIQLLVLV